MLRNRFHGYETIFLVSNGWVNDTMSRRLVWGASSEHVECSEQELVVGS
jgi:hypothetical protein